MSRRGVPGFWRERARGVGYVVLLGAAVLVVATVIATLALVVSGLVATIALVAVP